MQRLNIYLKNFFSFKDKKKLGYLNRFSGAKKFFQIDRMSVFGFFLLVFICFFVIIRMFAAPEDLKPHLRLIYDTPKPGHILGRDAFGRDCLVVYADAVCRSLTYALIASLSATFLGSVVGIFTALKGGIIEKIFFYFLSLIRTIDTRLIILIVNSMGRLTLFKVYLVFVLSVWASIAYRVQGATFGLLHREFIKAARLFGGSDWYLIRTHFFLNLRSLIFFNFVECLKFSIVSEGFCYALNFKCGNNPCLGEIMTAAVKNVGQGYDDRYSHLEYVPATIFLIIIMCLYQISLGARIRMRDLTQK